MPPTIAVGTCGYSYKDWVGSVYARGTKPPEMLAAYARQFTVVEIDSTYYRVPSAAGVASMAARTPAGFRFTAKLPGTCTHAPDAGTRAVHADANLFRTNLQPLIDAGKFVCALMQFPNSFRPNDRTRDQIAALRDVLDDVPLVAEFRHREWQTDETLTLLNDLRIGLVAVDEPQFESLPRPSSDVTSDIAYLRFHGRNYEQWWRGDNITRYDYLYTEDELGPWADRLVDIASTRDVKEVLSFFNNHRRGQAAQNAKMFEAMLRTRFPSHAVETAIDPAPPAEPLRFDLGL